MKKLDLKVNTFTRIHISSYIYSSWLLPCRFYVRSWFGNRCRGQKWINHCVEQPMFSALAKKIILSSRCFSSRQIPLKTQRVRTVTDYNMRMVWFSGWPKKWTSFPLITSSDIGQGKNWVSIIHRDRIGNANCNVIFLSSIK